MRLCSQLIVLNLLEFHLLFCQKVLVVFLDKIVDAGLLLFYLFVRSLIGKESTFQTLQNSSGRTSSLSIEFLSIRIFNILQIVAMHVHLDDSSFFFFILFSSKVLHSLQISDTLCGTLFVFPKFYDSTLDLCFLIIHTL